MTWHYNKSRSSQSSSVYMVIPQSPMKTDFNRQKIQTDLPCRVIQNNNATRSLLLLTTSQLLLMSTLNWYFILDSILLYVKLYLTIQTLTVHCEKSQIVSKVTKFCKINKFHKFTKSSDIRTYFENMQNIADILHIARLWLNVPRRAIYC